MRNEHRADEMNEREIYKIELNRIQIKHCR